MKHEKSISRRGLESGAGGCRQCILGMFLGVKDCRVTSRHHPKVLQAQSTHWLYLDNDFPAIVAWSLVNEVIAVSTVGLYFVRSMGV